MTSAPQPMDVYVRGMRLRAVHLAPAHAPENAPTIVFLHEALGSIGQWKSFPRLLCEAALCKGLVYERRGHGGSEASDSLRGMDFYWDESDTLLALLESLDIRKPLLFGHSDGGTIALAFTSRYADAASAVVSEAAHVMIEEVTISGIRSAAEAFATTDLRGKLLRYHGDNTDAVFNAWADTWLHPSALEWDMRKDLHGVHVPVLVIQGEDDRFGSAAQVHSIEQHVGGPVQSLLLPACGHVPHLEARDSVIEACVGFFIRHAFTSECGPRSS